MFGKIQRGAPKRGLKPQIFRENRGEILPGKSGLFGANWRHFRAGRGLFGADRDQFLCTPQPRGKSRNCPERTLFGPIGPFRAKPLFAKPPFGFPRDVLGGKFGPEKKLSPLPFSADTLPPPRPLPDFQKKKPCPPPLLAPRTSPPLRRKNNKYPKRPSIELT